MATITIIDKDQWDGAVAATADKIREKTGKTDSLEWDMNTGFESAVDAIVVGYRGLLFTQAASAILPTAEKSSAVASIALAFTSTSTGTLEEE